MTDHGLEESKMAADNGGSVVGSAGDRTAILPSDVRERVARALTVWLCCEECEPDWPDQLEMADVALAAAGLVPAECRFCAAEPGGEPACIDGGEHHHLWDFAEPTNGSCDGGPSDG